jgi:hypothetical protein
MERRALFLRAGLVRTLGLHYLVFLLDADPATEDPSEFFTMIFGGEAFVDWYGPARDTSN